MELIRRTRDDSDEYIEEVRRDFPPGDGAYHQRRGPPRDQYASRRARSADRGRYNDDYYGGESRGSRKDRKGKSQSLFHLTLAWLTWCKGGGRKYNDYSSSESESPPRRKNQRRKSLGESALAALGLGELAGVAGAGGRPSRSKSRGGRRRRERSYSSSPSRSRAPEHGAKIQQAVQAALTAGAVEAFRSRNEPGPWTGEKGKRVLTAAIGAGGVDRAIDRDPNKNSTRHTVEAVIGGLVANRLANGPRSRSRSRSRGRGGGGSGLKELAAGGLAAAAGKSFLDNRNRSKSRDRRRSYSSDYSDDSRSPPRRRPQNRSRRSKSLVGYVDKGLAALGLADNKRDRDDDRDRQGSRRSGGYDDGYSQPRSMPREEVARMRGGGGEGKGGGSGSSSDDDLSSSEEEWECKKMRGKEYLTAGLATVATIHAGHELYESYEKAQKRHKEVRQGKLSPQQARKMQSKALLQDAASVGIAALGIKGAVGNWKEMKESRDECHKLIQKRDERKKFRGERGSKNGRPDHGGRQPSYRNSAPNLYAGYRNGNTNGYAGGGPTYQDGNPYAAGALPPPPMGGPPARY